MSCFRKVNTIRWLVKLFCFFLVFVFVLCVHYLMMETGYYYSFTNSREDSLYSKNITATPRKNHNILHVLVLTYSRSGSSFVGKLLQSPKQAFYHFEPLHYLYDRTRLKTKKKTRSRRSLIKRPNVQDFLHDIFLCKYEVHFVHWLEVRSTLKIFQRNERYWSTCMNNNGTKLCFNPEYFHRVCSNYTMQVVKTIRMNIREATQLIEQHRDLNLKIIHLLRDPRGTMNSRSKPAIASWCRKDITCYSSRVFCSQLDSDLAEAEKLKTQYPGVYLPLRYEELCCNMQYQTERIFSFLGFDKVPLETLNFLHSHNVQNTKSNGNQKEKYLEFSYTTVRDSIKTAFAWRKELKFRNVNVIQRHCEKVFQKINYALVKSEKEMKDFSFRTILNTTGCDLPTYRDSQRNSTNITININ